MKKGKLKKKLKKLAKRHGGALIECPSFFDQSDGKLNVMIFPPEEIEPLRRSTYKGFVDEYGLMHGSWKDETVEQKTTSIEFEVLEDGTHVLDTDKFDLVMVSEGGIKKLFIKEKDKFDYSVSISGFPGVTQCGVQVD